MTQTATDPGLFPPHSNEAFLPFSPFADVFGFTPLPAAYWRVIALFLLCYAILAHLAKTAFFARYPE